VRSALAHFQTLPLKDAARWLHHAFQEIENKRFIIHHSSFILFTMPGSTLSNDLLSDKRFDFPFVNPPCGNEWSKDFSAVTSAAPMENNPPRPPEAPPARPQTGNYADTLTGQLGIGLDILIVGGQVDPKLQAEYSGKRTKFLAYRAVIATARTQLEWLIKQLNEKL